MLCHTRQLLIDNKNWGSPVSNIDGTWNTTINTPMGEQKSTLVLNEDGTGSTSSQMGSADITDAKIDGDSATFKVKIDAMGHDRIRSRVEVRTKDGRHLVQWADENYRGSPHNPLSDEQVEGKFRDCADGLLDDARSQQVFDTVWTLEDQPDVTILYDLLDWRGAAGRSQ